jgi:hypothetical protein
MTLQIDVFLICELLGLCVDDEIHLLTLSGSFYLSILFIIHNSGSGKYSLTLRRKKFPKVSTSSPFLAIFSFFLSLFLSSPPGC